MIRFVQFHRSGKDLRVYAKSALPASVIEATLICFKRYLYLLKEVASPWPDLSCSREHLIWMCDTAVEQGNRLPVDKVSRWLGFVQGVLTEAGIVTVKQERDYSRHLFHAAYKAEGLSPPNTVGRR